MAAWYVLKPILGDDYFEKLGENKPRAFDSYVQQYGRLVDGQDKVIMGAAVLGLHRVQGQGRAARLRLPRDRRSRQRSRASASSPTAPIRTPPSCSWTGSSSPVGQKAYGEHSAQPFAARGRAAASRRHADQGHEAAVPGKTSTTTRRAGRSSPRNGTRSSARGSSRAPRSHEGPARTAGPSTFSPGTGTAEPRSAMQKADRRAHRPTS